MYIFDIFTNLFRKQKCVRYLRNLYRENNRYKIYISRTNTGYRFILKFNNSESFWNFIDQKYIFAYYYIYYIKCIVFLVNPGQSTKKHAGLIKIFSFLSTCASLVYSVVCQESADDVLARRIEANRKISRWCFFRVLDRHFDAGRKRKMPRRKGIFPPC